MAGSQKAEGAEETFPGRDLPSAGVRRRLMASLADMVIFVGLSLVLFLPLFRAMPDLPTGGTAIDTVSSLARDTSWLSHVAGILGLWVALWWCYFLVGWGLMGCTPGKWLLGLRVVDYQGRCPIGASRAAMRLLAYMASSVTLIGGHMLAVLRGDRLALHDVLAGTRVVRWKRKPRRGLGSKGQRVKGSNPAEPEPKRSASGPTSNQV